jgi:hypothetical protein
VSRKRKAVVGLAGLMLAGGAYVGGVAAAPVAGAASPACGSACVSMYNQKFGSADVSAVSGGTAATGQAVTLAAAAPSTAEDWGSAFQGVVSDFYAAGLMNATLDKYYGPDPVFEFEYLPGGIASGECLGTASGARQGTRVTLQPCGKTAGTAWIFDTAAASGSYVPYISGSGSKYPGPYVLTAAQAGGGFTTQALRVDSKGVVAKDQMWQLISGVLYSAGRYAGKSAMVSVGRYDEPNSLSYVNYCGPAASRVLISNWTSNVPSLDTLAAEEKTNQGHTGTYLDDMVTPINNAIGTNFYKNGGAASDQSDFSNRLGKVIYDDHRPLITGIMTGVGNIHLNGWSSAVTHIITIYGFDFSSPTQGKIYYMETAGTVAGTTATGPQVMDYQSFWTLVAANNIQLINAN